MTAPASKSSAFELVDLRHPHYMVRRDNELGMVSAKSRRSPRSTSAFGTAGERTLMTLLRRSVAD